MAWRIPIVGLPTVDRHLPAVGGEAIPEAYGVGGARRNRARRAARRGPVDVLGRWSVAGVKEARRSSLGRRPALEHGLGAGHRVAPLLEGLTDRGEILRPFGEIEDPAGALVGLQRLVIALLGIVGDAGHLDVDIQGADVVAQGDEVVLGRPSDLLPLALMARLVSEEGHRLNHTAGPRQARVSVQVSAG